MRAPSRTALFILPYAVAASAAVVPDGLISSRGIRRGDCERLDTQGQPLQCATLPVPLDYTNPDSSDRNTLVRDLIRYPATNGTSKGTIMLNFGGPGEDGFLCLVENAVMFLLFVLC